MVTNLYSSTTTRQTNAFTYQDDTRVRGARLVSLYQAKPKRTGLLKAIKPLAYLALSIGLAGSVGVASLAGLRYSNTSLSNMSLMTEPVSGHTWEGNNISFSQQQNGQYNVNFQLEDAGMIAELQLQNIDLNLLIPQVPEAAQGNDSLTQWFLSEREFNRQRVVFSAGSEHISLPAGLAGYAAEDLIISLTNNCLGAGYWELAVSVQNEDGGSEKIYQGYFTFSRGAYAGLVGELNPTHYWQQARTMEGWPGFDFLSGKTFDLDALRQVTHTQSVPLTDLASEPIIAANEQVKKADLVVYADDVATEISTWADLRQTDLKFQSFVTPGIYDPERLWETDFSQIQTTTGATAREIQTTNGDLLELELQFENGEGEQRRFVLSGLDLEQIPQLDTSNYSDGVYMPMGFGTPFTQDYTDLVANPPAESSFFSVWLDAQDQVINYRQDIGLNGLVLHRDATDANKLHVYLMSYERITLVGHYVVDLSAVSF